MNTRKVFCFGGILCLLVMATACHTNYNHKINRLDWKNTIPQADLNDCGAAVMKMIFNYHNHNVSQEEIREQLPLQWNGVNMYELKSYAEQQDFEAQGIRCSQATLVASKEPMIFLMNWNHFVVVDSVAQAETVYLRDPLQGRCTLHLSTFLKYTDGLALIIHKRLLNPNQTVQ